MYFTDKHLKMIKNQPHLLGHMLGKILLTPMHSKWIKYIWDSDQDRSLQAHRDSYKTTSISIIGSIRWMLFYPGDRIGILRKKLDNASKVIKVIAELMELDEAKELFKYAHGFYPEIVELNQFRLTFNFKDTITPEGNINAYGIDSSITGAHLEKPIMDDFSTLKDRISKAEREKTKIIIQEIRTNIARQGKNKSTGFLGTPWHKNGPWTVCPEPLKYDVYQTGILSEEKIKERKSKITSPLWSINYELKHTVDDLLQFANPKYCNWKFSNLGVFGHLDAAFDGIATNALTFMAENEKKLQIVGFSYAGNVKHWKKTIIEKYKKYRCKLMYVEENPDKGYTADFLKDAGLNVISYNENLNKDTKITIYLSSVWDDLYFAKESDFDYMEQIVDYCPGEKPDDAPDSLASLIKRKFYKGKSYVDALWSA